MKKTFITLLLMIVNMLALSSSAQSLRHLTDQDVLSIAMADYSSSNTNYGLFVGNTNEKFTNTNNTLFNYLQNTTTQNAVVYIDEEPGKGWDHSCVFYYIPRYVPSSYTDNSSIPFYRVNATRPRGDYTLTSYSTISFGNISMPNVETLTNPALRLEDASHTFAIIFNGGLNKCANYPRYWNDCALVYQTLTRRFGIPASNISVLMADGTNSGDDMVYGYGSFCSSPTDLDGDNVADIDMAGTLSNLQSELQRLAGIMTTDDNLFIYTTGSGGVSGTSSSSSSYLWTWTGNSEQRMYDYQLSSLLNSFNVNSINVVMQQNSAAGFFDNIQGTGRVITASCGQQGCSYARSSKDYDEFTYYWGCAINERNLSSGVAVSSDADGDGYVRMGEAFNYVYSNDSQPETPQISPAASSALLAINKRPIGYELMIRDGLTDIGDDNTNAGYSYGASPDIWIRAQADGLAHQWGENVWLLNNSQTIYSYVRITNIGNKPYTGSGMYLHSYWALASLAQSWYQWMGIYGDGGPLTHVQITNTIQPGNSVILEYAWTVPDSLYSAAISNGTQEFSQLMVVDRYNTHPSFLPIVVGTTLVDVFGRNYIAHYNRMVYGSSKSSGISKPLWLCGTSEETCEYSIELQPVDNMEDVVVELKLPDSMYERWQARDLGTSKIISCDQSTRKVLLSGNGGILKNILLASEQKEKLYVACHINDASVKEKNSECVFDVIMRNQETGLIVGGFRITIPPIAEEPFAQAREIDVKEFNSISRITTSASDFMVSLSSPADYHTAIRISTLLDKSQTIEIQVPSDQKEVTAKLPGNKAGMFVVSLLQEGRVVETRKISIN